MPTTPPTIVAPLPHDPRVMLLAQATGMTRREAFGAAAEAWAWLAVMATDDALVKASPDALTALVDVAGFGPAMVTAGLVGVVDDGLVLPAELRRLERDQRRGRGAAAADGADDLDDETRRRRAGDRRRQRRCRDTKRNTKMIAKPSPSPVAEPVRDDRTPRRLGTVEGCPVMLLFSRKGDPFYKLCGAAPTEWTGTVTDRERPSLADAFVSLMSAMKRARDNGRATSASMVPTMEAVVSAARHYREARRAAADDAARRAAANVAFAEASADDHGEDFEGVTERDCHAPVTHVTRDAVTVTDVSRPESVTCPPNTSDDRDFRSVTRHGSVTEPAPSSSSSSLCPPGDEDKKTTTTTSSGTVAERDHEDDILDRMLAVPSGNGGNAPRENEDPEQARRNAERRRRFAWWADVLRVSAESVEWQFNFAPELLAARLRQAGIDPKATPPVNADAPDAARDARTDIDMTTEPSADDKPATGVVAARERDHHKPDPPEFDYPHWQLRAGLQRQGVASPTVNAPPAERDAFEPDGIIGMTTTASCGPL